MVPLGTPHLILFLTVLIAACIYDVLTRRVPNWLTVGMLCAGLGARFVELGIEAAGMGLLGALAGLTILIFPFHKRWVAGGDVKLLGASGGGMGPGELARAARVASVVGGLLSLYYLLRSPGERQKEILTNLRLSFFIRTIPDIGPRSKRESPPYTLALAAGAITILFLGRSNIGLG